MSRKIFPSISYNPKKHNLNYEKKYLQLNAKKFKMIKNKPTHCPKMNSFNKNLTSLNQTR